MFTGPGRLHVGFVNNPYAELHVVELLRSIGESDAHCETALPRIRKLFYIGRAS